MFTLINSTNLIVELDPIEINNYHPSVAFDITISWTVTFQRAKIEIKECWLENYELNQFQENLQHFIDKENNLVSLCDMGLLPILNFRRIEEDIFFEVEGKANVPFGSIRFETEIENNELVEILERMRTWAKWW